MADTDGYLTHKCGLGGSNIGQFSSAALTAYKEAFRDPATVHAVCEDYRAAASIDIEHDNEDDPLLRRIECPLLVLWGKHGVIERCFQPLELWRLRARHVSGHAIPAGHFLAEEQPDLVADALLVFFTTD